MPLDPTKITSLSEFAAKKAIKEYIEGQCDGYASQIILDCIHDPSTDYNNGWFSISEAQLSAMIKHAYASGGTDAVINMKTLGL